MVYEIIWSVIEMHEQVKEYLGKYPDEIKDLFCTIRHIVLESAPSEPQEMLWAKLPSYYVGESFVRLIPFQDHINIEAKAVSVYRNVLSGYRITPKGMVQIFLKQDVPVEALKQIFAETFSG